MKTLLRLLGLSYLWLSALLAHAVLLYLFWFQPAMLYRAIELVPWPLYPAQQSPARSPDDIAQQIQDELLSVMPVWQARTAEQFSGIWLDGTAYPTLAAAVTQLQDGSHLKIGPGVYREALNIGRHNVTIEGIGHAVLEQATSDGKGAIVARGDNLTIKNLECRHIKVASKNGACVRLEGRGLTLEHVYFHSSETALLETAKQHGYITILDSRFENLAANARAHSIYLNSASLHFNNSVILANRHQHSLKSRGPLTIIENSIIAELSAPGSRLIDISNGGELLIKSSLLQQGPNAVNSQAIGFGLEGIKHQTNQISITDSVVLLERERSNFLLHSGSHQPKLTIENNLIIAADDSYPHNRQLNDRRAAGLANYPSLPAILCNLHRCTAL
ncbi:right-handed parallel beta-helix repeat-containing protein [Rheinheimera gaetbuli]